MSKQRQIIFIAIGLAYGAAHLWGQNSKELEAVHQIKVEAFQNSKVMDHLANLTDVYGPRLTASPEWEEAAQWR